MRGMIADITVVSSRNWTCPLPGWRRLSTPLNRKTRLCGDALVQELPTNCAADHFSKKRRHSVSELALRIGSAANYLVVIGHRLQPA